MALKKTEKQIEDSKLMIARNRLYLASAREVRDRAQTQIGRAKAQIANADLVLKKVTKIAA